MRRVPFIAAFAVSAALAVPSPAQDAASTLILDDAIRLALGHNRSLKVVSYGRGISRANLLVAQGQFDPSLAFNPISSGTRSAASLGQVQLDDIRADYYSAALQGQLPVGTLYSVTASTQDVRDMYSGFARNYQTFGGFTVTQPLLKGFGFDANLEAVRVAKADRSISDLAYRQSAIDTVTNVFIAYSNLQLAHDQLDAAERARSLAASLLADNEKSFKIGSISQSDVITARFYVAAQEEAILIAERAVRDGQNQLRNLIGEDTFFEDDLQLAHDQLDAAERARSLAASLLADNEKSFKIGSISQSDVITARFYVALRDEAILI